MNTTKPARHKWKDFKSTRKVLKTHPWIPPPAKTSGSLTNLNLETNRHTRKNNTGNNVRAVQKGYPKIEKDTLLDIQEKVTELESFVKKLDSTLGKIRVQDMDTTSMGIDDIKIDMKHNDKFRNYNDEPIKVKEYKKKLKLLLKVIHASELENKKLKQCLEEKDYTITNFEDDRDKLKNKLLDSYNEKQQMESRLEKIIERLHDMENNQKDDTNERAQLITQNMILHQEIEKLKGNNSIYEKQLLIKEVETTKLKEKLTRSKKASMEKNSKGNKNPDSESMELEKLQITVEMLEKQNTEFLKSLKSMGRQLEESNQSIAKLTSDLNKTEKRLNSKKHVLDHDQKSTQRYISTLPQSTDLKYLQEELLASRIRLSLLDETLQLKSEEIIKLTKAKAEMENDCEAKLKDRERQLQIALNTNQSLQNYLTHLKNSYAAVFADPIL